MGTDGLFDVYTELKRASSRVLYVCPTQVRRMTTASGKARGEWENAELRAGARHVDRAHTCKQLTF